MQPLDTKMIKGYKGTSEISTWMCKLEALYKLFIS